MPRLLISVPILLVFLVAVTPSVADAQSSTGLVAVLPLDVTSAEIRPADRIVLEESIRTIAGDLLAPAGYSVLTGETMLAVLAENGVDADKACEASCALEAARELRASLFISGTVVTSEGLHVGFVRLFESATGRQLSSVKIEGERVLDLRRQFEAGATTFLSAVPSVSSRREGSPPVAANEASVAGPSASTPSDPSPSTPSTPSTRARPRFAVRAGVGGHTGILGAGFEWRPGVVGVALGTGTHALSGGLTFGPKENAGGFYVDVHAAWVRAGLVGGFGVVGEGAQGVGLGATVGWDLRPLKWLSVKAGVGAGWNSLRGPGLLWDLNVGPVF